MKNKNDVKSVCNAVFAQESRVCILNDNEASNVSGGSCDCVCSRGYFGDVYDFNSCAIACNQMNDVASSCG